MNFMNNSEVKFVGRFFFIPIRFDSKWQLLIINIAVYIMDVDCVLYVPEIQPKIYTILP